LNYIVINFELYYDIFCIILWNAFAQLSSHSAHLHTLHYTTLILHLHYIIAIYFNNHETVRFSCISYAVIMTSYSPLFNSKASIHQIFHFTQRLLSLFVIIIPAVIIILTISFHERIEDHDVTARRCASCEIEYRLIALKIR